MADWLKRITNLISSPRECATTPNKGELNQNILKKLEDLPLSVFSEQTQQSPTFSQRAHLHKKNYTKDIPTRIESPPSPPVKPKEEEKAMATNEHEEDDDNLKALKRLRELPRGTHVESRIAAVKNLLGEGEIFKTLKMLRWPQGVLCPKCHSSNVIRKDPPIDAVDQRHYYVCLNCKSAGGSGDFDDFTGLPIGSLHALRQWILCWYLIGFCSVNQIAKALGISVHEVMQIATLGNELTELPDEEAQLSAKSGYELRSKKEGEQQKQKRQVEQQEEYTRSESKSPLKPGYKSKK
ncbi:MAG: hypothetical protein BGO43_11655 [Gammaproteobacteria bacterium 39-13]|nr:transposase [Gammaproteobacteria bacterium]OJV85281.1 MAG: hypothetical protein BGO43_11655 [Gammaproteobacteria bacterium 39-13]